MAAETVTSDPVFFDFDAGLSEDDLVAALASRLEPRWGLQRERERRHHLTYFDTFDWRLWNQGATLRWRQDPPELIWREVAGLLRHRLSLADPREGGSGKPGDGSATASVAPTVGAGAGDAAGEELDPVRLEPGQPFLPSALPQGPLREELEDAAWVRCLLPRVTVRRRRRLLRVLNDNQKTVVRLVLERRRAADPERPRRSAEVAPVLRVVAVKGYDQHFRGVLEALGEEPLLTLARGDELTSALTALGRWPGDYSSKIQLDLDPQERADQAMKGVLLSLLRAMEANEDGTRKALDPEFLHDFRVAVRRSRAALGQVQGVFPEPVVEHFKTELKWLGRATGPKRDLDVYSMQLPDYREQLPTSAGEALAPLRTYLDRHSAEEQERLEEVLTGSRYRNLLEEWRRFLEQPVPESTDLPNAQRPLLEVASERIWKMWRRVFKRGRAIDEETPAEALHSLRIDCKKLRYLLEFFRSLYAEKEVARLVKSLKKLQDNLGDFNDLEVQQETLQSFAAGMEEEGLAPVDTILAMGRLVERMAQGQARERDRFEKRFQRFSAKANRRQFRELFRTAGGEKAS